MRSVRSGGDTHPVADPKVVRGDAPSARPQFAHESEEELARLLDFYGIRWEYEPRSFPLEWDDAGRVLESFNPDFYLPDVDLYIELTTLKQSLVTRKNRKVRRLRELYPDVRLEIFYGRDYRNLLLKYGLAKGWDSPAPYVETLAHDIDRVLFTEAQIQDRIRELAEAISADYEGKTPLLVSVLKGALYFIADLSRAVNIPVAMDFMAITSYGGEQASSGAVRLIKDLDEKITGRHVILVEDIIDTGLTAAYLLRTLTARDPASIRICTLLDKSARRIVDTLPIDYRGFDVPDIFVVGYGLDYRQLYRNLPFIGVLKADAISRP